MFILGRLLLPACATQSPLAFLSFGTCAAAAPARDDGSHEEAERARLEARIADLRRQISLTQCTAVAPPGEIDENAWRRGDLGAMQGCWELESDYLVRNVDQGGGTNFSTWTMCLNADGSGEQVMGGENSARCSGNVQARFDEGRFVVEDEADVQCDNGFQIFRRITTCRLAGDGTADCESVQPDPRGGRGPVRLRRR